MSAVDPYLNRFNGAVFRDSHCHNSKLLHQHYSSLPCDLAAFSFASSLLCSPTDFSQPVSFENAEIGQCPDTAPPPPPGPIPEEKPEGETKKDDVSRPKPAGPTAAPAAWLPTPAGVRPERRARGGGWGAGVLTFHSSGLAPRPAGSPRCVSTLERRERRHRNND